MNDDYYVYRGGIREKRPGRVVGGLKFFFNYTPGELGGYSLIASYCF